MSQESVNLIPCCSFEYVLSIKNGLIQKNQPIFWCERWDSNPHGITTRTSNVLVYHSNTLANMLDYYSLPAPICQYFSVKKQGYLKCDTLFFKFFCASPNIAAAPLMITPSPEPPGTEPGTDRFWGFLSPPAPVPYG